GTWAEHWAERPRNIMARFDYQQLVRERLDAEVGTIFKTGRTRVALLKPSTYHVSMSSLGLQHIYRVLNALPDVVAERAFLPDDVEAFAHTRGPLTTYESGMPVGDADIIAVSLAYEIEPTALLRCLDLSGMPLLASDRGEGYPLVVMGGPLTFSNILPAAPFADVVIM